MPLKLSFASKEVVVPGTVLCIHSPCPVDVSSAKEGVRLFRGKTELEVRVEVHGNEIQLSTNGLASGLYKIRIDPLRDASGQYINTHAIHTAICVRKMCGQVPENLRIEHVVHLAVGELSITRLRPGESAPDGALYVEAVKAAHPQTHFAQRFIFDADGKLLDEEEVLSGVAKRRYAKFGVIHESLWYDLEDAEEDELFEVTIWPRLDHDHCDYEKTASHAQMPPGAPGSRHISSFQRPKAELMAMAEEFRVEIEQHAELPPLTTSLTKSQIQQMSLSKNVGGIFQRNRLHKACGPKVADGPRAAHRYESLASSLTINRADRAQTMGYMGVGVKVAVHELGPSDRTDLDFAGRYLPNPASNPLGPLHAAMVSAIIKNTQKLKPHGFAPGCLLYSANIWNDAALKWAIIDNKCSIINQSWVEVPAELSATMTDEDLLKDWYATTPPYVLFVQAAGNQDETHLNNNPPIIDYVCPKGYNNLIVGSHIPSGTAMADDSDFTNPPIYSTNRTSANVCDRELPDICANGVDVCVRNLVTSGTSFATPAVAGVAALIQGIDSVLQSSPEACRAILYAAAGRRILAGSTWYEDIHDLNMDLRDGAGILDAEAAVKIARNQISQNAGTTQTQAGWGHGLLGPSQFDANTLSVFRYRIHTPALLASGTTQDPLTLRVALAWNGKIFYSDPQETVLQASRLTVNLDVLVLDAATGTQAAFSSTFDNSYEIAEFVPMPDSEYEIVIRCTVGTDIVWYGIAWGMFIGGQSV